MSLYCSASPEYILDNMHRRGYTGLFSVLTASSTFPENAARTTVPWLFSFVRPWIVLGKDDTLTEGDHGF